MRNITLLLSLVFFCATNVFAQGLDQDEERKYIFSRESIKLATISVRIEILKEDKTERESEKEDDVVDRLAVLASLRHLQKRSIELATDYLAGMKIRNRSYGPFDTDVYLGLEVGSSTLRYDLTSDLSGRSFRTVPSAIYDRPWNPFSHGIAFILYPIAEVSAAKELPGLKVDGGFTANFAKFRITELYVNDSGLIYNRVDRNYQLAVLFFINIVQKAP